MEKKLKMYILIKESVPNSKAIVGAAHASLACYLKFKHTSQMKDWLSGPFYKTVCRISDQEFEKVKQIDNHTIITESTLNNDEIIIAFCPRTKYPKQFQFHPLFS